MSNPKVNQKKRNKRIKKSRKWDMDFRSKILFRGESKVQVSIGQYDRVGRLMYKLHIYTLKWIFGAY